MKNLIIVGVAGFVLGSLVAVGVGSFTRDPSAQDLTSVTTKTDREKANALAKVKKLEKELAQIQGEDGESLYKLNPSDQLAAISPAMAEYTDLLTRYSEFDAQACVEEFESLKDLPRHERGLAMGLLFNRWAEVDPLGAIDATNDMGFRGSRLKNEVLQSWLTYDSQGVIDWFTTNKDDMSERMRGDGRWSTSMQSIIASNLASKDPASALDFIQSLNAGQEKEKAYEGFFESLVRSDLAQAKSYLNQAPADLKGEVAAEIAAAMAKGDLTNALTWVDTLPADQRDLAVAGALENIASQDPDQAVALFESLQDQEAINESISTMSDIISSQQGSLAAADWVMNLDTGKDKDSTYRALYEIGKDSVEDTDTFLTWLNQNEQSKQLDVVIHGYLRSIPYNDFEARAIAAESYKSKSDRKREVNRIVEQWRDVDPVKADEFLETSEALR